MGVFFMRNEYASLAVIFPYKSDANITVNV